MVHELSPAVAPDDDPASGLGNPDLVVAADAATLAAATTETARSRAGEGMSDDFPGDHMARGGPTEENKTIARLIRSAFGGNTKVTRYSSEDTEAEIHIASSEGSSERAQTWFATVGLSDWPIGGEVTPPLGTEFVGAGDDMRFGNAMATAAFNVMTHGWLPEPDRLYPHLLDDYFPDVTCKHLFLVVPFLWPELDPQVMESKTVAFVMLVPITDGEMQYFDDHGPEALLDALETARPSITDLHRESVV